MTTNQRREWLEDRQTGIGGSDAASIFNEDPFGRTTEQLYDEKVNPVVDEPMTGPMKRGVVLEPIAVDEYVVETNRVVVSREQQRHPEYPWMIANVDRELEAIDDRGPGILEVKCPGIKAFYRYINEGLHEGYIMQMQHYLSVTGYKWGSFAIFNAEPWKIHYFDVDRDDELIGHMIEGERAFWDLKMRGVRPGGPLGTVDVKAVKGVIVKREDPEWAAAWGPYWEAKELAKTSELLIAEARSVIEELCGEYGSYEGAGSRLHWKMQKGKKTFDRKRLALAGPLDRDRVRDMLIAHDGAEATASIDFEALALDLEPFFNQGDPKPSFRPYPIKSKQEEE